jgi:PAS domain S-box-containing protein
MQVIRGKLALLSGRYIGLHHLIVWLYGAFVVVTACVLAALLMELRSDDIANGKKLLTAVAQLADEQTSGTLQNVQQGLQIAYDVLSAVKDKDRAREETIDPQLHKLVEDRSYLTVIRVLDTHGRAVHNSDTGYTGLDLSDRAYFKYHRDNPTTGFNFGAPIRNRVSGKWVIPVTLPVRGPAGEFEGVMVAGVDSLFFTRVWAIDGELPKLSMTLFKTDGVMLMRNPFAERLIGKSYSSGYIFRQIVAGIRAGAFENRSDVDGEMRLFAYRQLTGFPDLVLVAGQATDQVLAAWWRIVQIVASGWLVATLVVGALTAWLIREAKARLATQDRYRMLFESNPHPVAVIERDTGRFLAVNDAAVKQYGWSREELLAMSANDLYRPADVPAAKAMRLEAASDATPVFRGLRHHRKDGAVIDVETSARGIELEGTPAILTIAQDVTERRMVEQQLRQAQKMEAVGQLTGGIAHDFNNILMVVMANVEAMEEEEKNLDPYLLDRIKGIARATQRAADLTRQLLAFSRKQALRPQVTDINDLVAATGTLLRRTLGEQIEIESILADDLWTVRVDRAQLEAALINLAINARDAMPKGGRLLIETLNTTLDKRYAVENPDAVPGDYVLLAVSDTGSGMSADVLAKVFEPFFTTKGVGKGTGLGLSMIYGFIKQSDGHIKIYSDVGRGTSIKLYLPRTEGGAAEPVPEQGGSTVGGSERVLVVEDDPQVRAGVVHQLKSLGYSVEEATDGAAGLAAFEQAAVEAAPQPYDLLLTDVVMPGPINGKSLADAVARRWPNTRILFMSGYTENAMIHQGRLESGAPLLSKPFRKRDLAQAMRRLLDGAGDGAEVRGRE